MQPALTDIYTRHIRGLSADDRLRLLALLANELAADGTLQKKRSLLELEGLGAEVWDGIDAQKYVNDSREEWDRQK